MTPKELAQEFASKPPWERADPQQRMAFFNASLDANPEWKKQFEGVTQENAKIGIRKFFDDVEQQFPGAITQRSTSTRMEQRQDTTGMHVSQKYGAAYGEPKFKEVEVQEEHSRPLYDPNSEKFIHGIKEGDIDPQDLPHEQMAETLPLINELKATGELDDTTAEAWGYWAKVNYFESQGIKPDKPGIYDQKFWDQAQAKAGNLLIHEGAAGFAQTILSLSPVVPQQWVPDAPEDAKGVDFRVPLFNSGVDLGATTEEEREIFGEAIDLARTAGGLGLVVGGGIQAGNNARRAVKAAADAKSKAAAATVRQQGAVSALAPGAKFTPPVEAARKARQASEQAKREVMDGMYKNPLYIRKAYAPEAILAGMLEGGTKTPGLTSSLLGLQEEHPHLSKITTMAEAVGFLAIIDRGIGMLSRGARDFKTNRTTKQLEALDPKLLEMVDPQDIIGRSKQEVIELIQKEGTEFDVRALRKIMGEVTEAKQLEADFNKLYMEGNFTGPQFLEAAHQRAWQKGAEEMEQPLTATQTSKVPQEFQELRKDIEARAARAAQNEKAMATAVEQLDDNEIYSQAQAHMQAKGRGQHESLKQQYRDDQPWIYPENFERKGAHFYPDGDTTKPPAYPVKVQGEEVWITSTGHGKNKKWHLYGGGNEISSNTKAGLLKKLRDKEDANIPPLLRQAEPEDPPNQGQLFGPQPDPIPFVRKPEPEPPQMQGAENDPIPLLRRPEGEVTPPRPRWYPEGEQGAGRPPEPAPAPQQSDTILGYTFEEIQAAQQGGRLGKLIDPRNSSKPQATASDIEKLKEYGEEGLKSQGLHGVLDRLNNSNLLGHPKTFDDTRGHYKPAWKQEYEKLEEPPPGSGQHYAWRKKKQELIAEEAKASGRPRYLIAGSGEIEAATDDLVAWQNQHPNRYGIKAWDTHEQKWVSIGKRGAVKYKGGRPPSDLDPDDYVHRKWDRTPEEEARWSKEVSDDGYTDHDRAVHGKEVQNAIHLGYPVRQEVLDAFGLSMPKKDIPLTNIKHKKASKADAKNWGGVISQAEKGQSWAVEELRHKARRLIPGYRITGGTLSGGVPIHKIVQQWIDGGISPQFVQELEEAGDIIRMTPGKATPPAKKATPPAKKQPTDLSGWAKENLAGVVKHSKRHDTPIVGVQHELAELASKGAKTPQDLVSLPKGATYADIEEAVSRELIKSGKNHQLPAANKPDVPRLNDGEYILVEHKAAPKSRKMPPEQAILPSTQPVDSKVKAGREMLHNILVDGNTIVATDGKVLVTMPNTGKLKDGQWRWNKEIKEFQEDPNSYGYKGREIGTKFPNYKAVLSGAEGAPSIADNVDARSLMGELNAIDKGLKNFSKSSLDDGAPSVLLQGDNPNAFQVSTLKRVVKSLKDSGAETFTIRAKGGKEAHPIVIEGDNGSVGMVMPMRYELGSLKKYGNGILLQSIKPTNKASNWAAGHIGRQLALPVSVAGISMAQEDDEDHGNAQQAMAGFILGIGKARAKALNLGARFKTALKGWTMPAGNLPGQSFGLKMKKLAGEKVHSNRILGRANDLNRAIKEEFGKDRFNFDESLREQANEYLAGGSAGNLAQHPKTLQALQKMRNDIDRMSDELIGFLPKDIAATISDNKGIYLHRSYKAFDNIGYKPSEAHRQAAYDYLTKNGFSHEEAEGALAGLIHDKNTKQGLASLFDMERNKMRQILKRRKNFDKTLLDYMGEHKDPFINYQRTAARMSGLIEQLRWEQDVITDGMAQGYLSKGRESGKMFEKISMGNPHSKLNNYYAEPHVAKALETMEDYRPKMEGIMGHLWSTYLHGKAAVQVGKTIYSPATHNRNFISNGIFTGAQGHWDGLLMHLNLATKEGRKYLKEVKEGLFGETDGQLRQKFQEYLDMGLIGTGGRASEIQEAMRHLDQGFVKRMFDRFTNQPGAFAKSLSNLKKAGMDAPTMLYQLEDDFWKIWAYEHELKRYKKALPNASQQQLKDMALNAVHKTLPNYNYVPKAIKALRTMPLGNFVAFPYESTRISINTVRLALEEMKNPATRAIGAKRLGSFFTIGMGGTLAVSELSKKKNEVSPEADRDVRRFVEPWMKRAQFIYTSPLDQGDGKFSLLNVSNVDGYQQVKRPLFTALTMNRLDDETATDLFGAVTAEFMEPFLGVDMTARTLDQIRRNKNSLGTEIYNPQDDLDTRMEKIAGHVWRTLQPGAVHMVKNFKDASKGVKGKTLEDETFALLSGTRNKTYDLPEQVRRRWGGVHGSHAQTLNARRQFNSVAKSSRSPTPEQITQAYLTANRSRYKVMQEVYKDVVALRRTFRLSDQKIFQMLRANNFSKKESIALMHGNFTPINPPDRRYLNEAAQRGNVIDARTLWQHAKDMYFRPLTDDIQE